MIGDMNSRQERAILELMTKITSIVDLGTLLDVVVGELPSVVGARGCWIYLQSDYVPNYGGFLMRGEKVISEEDVNGRFGDFVVLAATNLESKKTFIGKAYFGEGEGITGWVYKNGKSLRITNVMDDKELKSYAHDLAWANEYHDGDELYKPGESRPLLAIPLIIDDSPIGTLKFHATFDRKPFSKVSEDVSVIVSQIISGVLRQTRMVTEQREIISRLIETGNKNTPVDVISDVTRSLKEMLSCSRTEYFASSEDGAVITLTAKNGEQVSQSDKIEFTKGQSLIGWVFKTGLPLVISNLRDFSVGKTVDDDLLKKNSIIQEINDEDRFLKWDESPIYSNDTSKLQIVSFLAVPVKSNNQEIKGVLCAYRNIKTPFEHSHLALANSFGSTIALAIENERQKILGDLLIHIGDLTQTDQLFNLINNSIPKLVTSSGCSIFTTVTRRGVTHLKLTASSRKGLVFDGKNMPDVEYELGEAKTGMCGRYQSIIIANHYGKGRASQERIDKEVKRISSEHPDDTTSVLFDSSGNKVGVFQFRADKKLPLGERIAIREFAKSIVFESTGLISKKLEPYLPRNASRTWSFVAVPISSDNVLLGVITLARPIPESPFLVGDVTLLKSIAGRLASVMNNLRILKLRERLLMSLAHEINTPIAGVLADSQNLLLEAPENSEMQRIAGHNLGQISRLHMQASAIMSVLSEQEATCQLTKHSIFLPVKEACELFESEALQNGCNILGPKTIDGGFPVIEMCLFDLTIAFKNIVHNAVKYSFRPPANKDIHRTIKVWGQWDKKRKGNYIISVQNYGVGIKPHEIDKRLIFEPFYRGENATDRKRTGTGFGLAHARLVIEEFHHGFVDVTSIHQGGEAYLTTFSISLPTAQSKI